MPEGLRERKKRQTRETIADAAMELFTARGYDAVTVADVAAAADVSEKTVFNYFPTKEDLVFHRGQERRAALMEAVRNRPPGTSLVEPFRRWTMDFLDTVERGPVEAIVAVPRLVRESRTLHGRLQLGWEQEAHELAPLMAAELGESEDDVVPVIVARTLAWAYRIVFRAAVMRLLDGEDRRAVAADLRPQADRAFDLLEGGLVRRPPRAAP